MWRKARGSSAGQEGRTRSRWRGVARLLVTAAVGLTALPGVLAAQQVVDCRDADVAETITQTGGWCFVAEGGYLYNPLVNWAFEPNRQVLYDYASGTYYSLQTGWLYAPQTGLYYHAGANWAYDPQSGLVYDFGLGVYYSPETGWLYEPRTGVFYHPASGTLFEAQTGQLFSMAQAAGGAPQTSNALLNEVLDAAASATAQNAAYVAQAPSAGIGVDPSLLSPVGQGLAGVSSAMRNLRGALDGTVSAAQISRQFQLSNGLNGAQAATQAVSTGVLQHQLEAQYKAWQAQAATDGVLAQYQAQSALGGVTCEKCPRWIP